MKDRWCSFNSGASPCDKDGHTAHFATVIEMAEHVRDKHPVEWFFIEHGGVVPA